MSASNNRHHDIADPVPCEVSDIPALRRLAEARVAMDHARQQAKWRRECKKLHAAAHAVRVAASAAHDAGIGWNEIGDVLGIERAIPPAAAAQVGTPPPTQERDAVTSRTPALRRAATTAPSGTAPSPSRPAQQPARETRGFSLIRWQVAPR